MKRHQRSVLRMSLRFVKDMDVAEDVTQEAFIKAYEKLHSFEGRALQKLVVPDRGEHRKEQAARFSPRNSRHRQRLFGGRCRGGNSSCSWGRGKPSAERSGQGCPLNKERLWFFVFTKTLAYRDC